MKPRLLDLFCCAGGASMGYSRVGFDVTGVDIKGRKAYPFNFFMADAVSALFEIIKSGEVMEYDLIHASPPCQAYTSLQQGTNSSLGKDYPMLYEPIKALLESITVPSVIENPASRPDLVLCGEMFGLGVLRHRRFELINWTTEKPKHVKHRGRVRGWRHGVYHDGPYVAAYGKGGGKASIEEMQEAMGIDWTDSHGELTEAIPPAYTQYIGEQFLNR